MEYPYPVSQNSLGHTQGLYKTEEQLLEVASSLLLYVQDILTTVVPPVLPLALSVALSVSFVRLQQQRISCINPARILGAGRCNLAAFDKTGTLTEDRLRLAGVCPMRVNNEGMPALGLLQQDIPLMYERAQQVHCQNRRELCPPQF